MAGVYDKWLKWNKNIIMADTNPDQAFMDKFISSPYEHANHAEILKPEFEKQKNFVK